jgi:hypothetical protein
VNQRIVIHSLEELGQIAELIDLDDQEEVGTPPAEPSVETVSDLASLAAAASRAAAQLQELVERDAVARRQAELALAQHHRLQEEVGELERIAGEADAVHTEAVELSTSAFDRRCREASCEVSTAAGAVATTATATLSRLREEVATLAAREDVARLLAEEQARAEAARREEEARQRIEAFQRRADEVEARLREGKENEAEELLGHLVSDQPNEPAMASRIDNLRRRLWGVKTVRVEEALREARRLHRHKPQAAVELLQEVDLSDMPEELVRQTYGCWLDASRRLGSQGVFHHAAGFGKGAVLAPAAGGSLQVISVLGVTRLRPGQTVQATSLRNLRPLR